MCVTGRLDAGYKSLSAETENNSPPKICLWSLKHGPPVELKGDFADSPGPAR